MSLKLTKERLNSLYEKLCFKEFEKSKFYTGIVIINKKKDSVLLGKRKEDGIWTSPGGHPEDNEAPEETALRELEEEANIKIDKKFLNKLDIQKASDGVPVYVYYVVLNEKNHNISPKNDPDDEVPKWQWFKFDNLPKGVTKDKERFISILNAIVKTLSYEERLSSLHEKLYLKN